MGAVEVGVISAATMEASEREGDRETSADDVEVEDTWGLEVEWGGVLGEEGDVLTGRLKLGTL